MDVLALVFTWWRWPDSVAVDIVVGVEIWEVVVGGWWLWLLVGDEAVGWARLVLNKARQ